MVDAVEKAAEQSDKWRSFMAEADEAEDEFERTGEGYEAKEMFRYYEEKAAGRNPPHPKPVKWR